MYTRCLKQDVKRVDFVGTKMIFTMDGQAYRVDLSSVSSLLANAKDTARRSYNISPSGYGIHRPEIDEDLSIDGLIAAARLADPESAENLLLLKEQSQPKSPH